jgi:hypothetical protein
MRITDTPCYQDFGPFFNSSLHCPLVGFIAGPILIITGIAQVALNIIGMVFSAIPSIFNMFNKENDSVSSYWERCCLQMGCFGCLHNYSWLSFSNFLGGALHGFIFVMGWGIFATLPGTGLLEPVVTYIHTGNFRFLLNLPYVSRTYKIKL